MMTLICVVLLCFGLSAFRGWLLYRKSTKDIEIRDEKQKELFSAMRFESAQQTERVRLIVQMTQNRKRNNQVF